MILKHNNEGMWCLSVNFFKRKKVYMRGISTRCGGARESFVYFLSFNLHIRPLCKGTMSEHQFCTNF